MYIMLNYKYLNNTLISNHTNTGVIENEKE